MPRSPEAMPAPAPSNEESEKKEDRRRHLRVVTEKDEIPDMTDEAVLEGSVTFDELTSAMEKERAEMGAAKAKGREARAIMDVQAVLAHKAVEELEAEVKEEAEGFGTVEMKPPAEKASLWDRVKGWFR